MELWPENFDHVKSPKLFESLALEYPSAIASGYSPGADGPPPDSLESKSQPARSSPFPEVSSGREYETWNCKLHLQPKA